MEREPTVRSSLIERWHLARTLRRLKIYYDPDKCVGVWQCYEVCPVGCWTPEPAVRKVAFHDPQLCIACGACVLQCPENAIELK